MTLIWGYILIFHSSTFVIYKVGLGWHYQTNLCSRSANILLVYGQLRLTLFADHNCFEFRGWHNVFILSRNLRWSLEQRDMWLSKRELHNLSHHCVKLHAYRFQGSWDITFCFVTWHHMTTWSRVNVIWLLGAPHLK